MLDVDHAARQYCVYILTIPWLVKRLPPLRRPAIKHNSILFPCFLGILILRENISMEISHLIHLDTLISSKAIPSVGWVLTNIICLATGNENECVDPQCFHQEPMDTVIYENEEADDSLPIPYIDQFRPVCQQWHLQNLLATANKDATDRAGILLPNGLKCLGKLNFSYIALFYSNMLKIYSILNPIRDSLPLLNMLSFTPGFLVKSHAAMNNAEPTSSHAEPSQTNEDSSDVWDIEPMRRGPQGISKDTFALLHIFCATYSHLLLVLDDIEFYEKEVPFKLEKQRRIASMLNTLVYNGLSHGISEQNRSLMNSAIRCLHLMYERNCRHQFCPPDLWLSPARKSRPPIAMAARTHEISSVNIRYDDSLTVHIRRGHIVEDGFRQLNSLGTRLKSSIHVSFVSECGLPEAGLDYGGLSKEFLTDISKAAFAPEYGLFSQNSTSDRLLIPNSSARFLDNGLQMIEFLGRVVGKALHEGILLDYSFSHVFVQKLLGGEVAGLGTEPETGGEPVGGELGAEPETAGELAGEAPGG
ncbi:hypothetical protein K1719_009392 [Acacia pycnantha]|nr:hypothetical protein K1719_009392 [Acacia pycnantha]